MAYYNQHDAEYDPNYDQSDLAEGGYYSQSRPLPNPFENEVHHQPGLSASYSEPVLHAPQAQQAFPTSISSYDYPQQSHTPMPLGASHLRPPYQNPALGRSSTDTINNDLDNTPYDQSHAYPDQGQDVDDIPLMARSQNSIMPGGFVDGQAYPPQDDFSMVRYGKIPSRQPRRFKTMKRVELYNGNLVLDCPVPSKLLAMCGIREGREFTHMRYTAATCDPNDFEAERYTLRQIFYDPPRSTELFIVLTMYNEDEVLFCRSMQGVLKNIAHLCKRDRSKTWGKDGWKKIVVCVVADGRSKINSRTLSVLAALGVYQEGVCKDKVNGKDTTAHVFEYTTQISIDPELRPSGSEKGVVPVQIIFCLKQQNQKKINSHRWFFNAFGPILKPNICVLLDVGTQPGPSSIYHLWKAFDLNSNIAGACGEIVALKGKYFNNLLNPLVAAQNFEYKMSNILDKPTESVFGYISVLPGAFSAYRYIALQNDVKGRGPLSEYFKGETLHLDANTDLWTKNMYLAEDRILCWELVSKRNSSWLLHYVRNAYAITDVPDRLPELISQRRRWLNGSFFAAIHATVHFGYLYRSSHSFLRKLLLHFELFYTIYNMVFAWFALANWYITFEILTSSLADPSFHQPWAKYVNTVLHYVYLALLVMCFLLAMGNRPQGSNKTFTTAVVFFALITCYMTGIAIFLAVRGIENVTDAAREDGHVTASDFFTNAIFRLIVLSLAATYGLYTLASLLFMDPWHMVTSLLQYILLAPSYTNIINVYAFVSLHVGFGAAVHAISSAMSTTFPGHFRSKVEAQTSVKSNNKNEVEVSVASDSKEVDQLYDDAWAVLQKKAPKAKTVVDPATKAEDSYKNIRTNVVMFWTITNGALVAAILSTGASANIATTANGIGRAGGYMTFILFSVAGLAAVRFVFSTIYLIGWLFTG